MLKLVQKMVVGLVVVLGIFSIASAKASENKNIFFNPGPHESEIYAGIVKDITPEKDVILYQGHRYVYFEKVKYARKRSLLFGKKYLKVLVIFDKDTNTFKIAIRDPDKFEPVVYIIPNTKINIGKNKNIMSFYHTSEDGSDIIVGSIEKKMHGVFEIELIADSIPSDELSGFKLGQRFYKKFKGIVKN